MKNKSVFGLIKAPAFLGSNGVSDEVIRNQRDSLEIKREILKKLSVRMKDEGSPVLSESQTGPFKQPVICPLSSNANA